MKTINILLMLASSLTAASVGAVESERYALPKTKAYLELCNQAAMTLHPGSIETQREQHSDGDFWIYYQIMMPDSSEWVVVCDLANGKIIRDAQEPSGDSPRR